MASKCAFGRLRVIIRGNPAPQQRPRLSRGRVFDPSKKQKERLLIDYLRAAGSSHKCAPDGVALNIRLVFSFKRPKSHYRTGKFSTELKKTAPAEYEMLKTPDVDNLAKLVLDSLNGSLYFDDKQVVSLSTVKRYAEANVEGSTIIDVSEFCSTDAHDATDLRVQPCLTCPDDELASSEDT